MSTRDRGFDWLRFFRRHRVDYATSGPNVSRGHVVVRCPFCGRADPSMHMSVDLKGRYWRCWRVSAHSGQSRSRLIRALLGCTEEEARALAGEDAPAQAPAPDELAHSLGQLRALVGGAQDQPPPGPLRFPREFQPLLSGSPMAQPFHRYLRERGYRDGEVRWLAETYELHYAIVGEFAWRLIVPVRGRYGELLTWTGRTISPEAQPRYRTLSVSRGQTTHSLGDVLLGLPVLWEASPARVLVLCEGPLDAMRLSASGHALGVWATCLFGLSLRETQRASLLALSERFERVCLLLDAEAQFQAHRMVRDVAPLDLRLLDLPPGVGDPGELSAAQAARLCLGLIGEARDAG